MVYEGRHVCLGGLYFTCGTIRVGNYLNFGSFKQGRELYTCHYYLTPFLHRRKTMKDTDKMSQDERDLWSDINNPNNEADMDDWADAHNPNNEDYIGDDQDEE